MQKNTKKGFSLVEVIVATLILSITVFGIYKLISENSKFVESSTLELQQKNLLFIIKNCIENTNITDQEMYLDLNNCNFSTSRVENEIDNIKYVLQIKTTTNLSQNIIFWDISVSDEFLGKKTERYVQRK